MPLLKLFGPSGTQLPPYHAGIQQLSTSTFSVEADLPRRHLAPNHWRFGMGDRPPLDISFDPATGAIVAAQAILYADDDLPLDPRDYGDSEIPVAGLYVDLDSWPAKLYVDEVVPFGLALDTAGVVRLTLRPSSSAAWRRSGALAVAVEADGELCALAIGPFKAPLDVASSALLGGSGRLS